MACLSLRQRELPGSYREGIVTKVVIRTDDVTGFFSRAKDAARRADQGGKFDGSVTRSFEDPEQMFSVLSPRLVNPGRRIQKLVRQFAPKLK